MKAIAGQSMFGMHKRMQGIHLRLHLTACKKQNNETSPLLSVILISKPSTWICFTASVVCVASKAETRAADNK